ncbi:hypothetical protein AB0B94_31210 [Micromonospora sp. NPDC048986]|uniref:hypothetical protein n=1 Tax=Micromonospora sp. NPDC048986 TaxID=3155644 RepID=UPI003409388B
MIRTAWTPDDDEQRKALADATRLARKHRQAEAAKWAGMLRARVLGVPDEVLCDETGESRATLNRRFGPRRATAVTWSGDNFAEIQVLRPQARLTEGGDLELESTPEGNGWVVVGRGYVVRHPESGS